MVDEPLKIAFKGFLTFIVLHELDKKQLSGEDLAKKIGQRRGAQLTPGTIYPTMKKLRKLGLVKYKRFGRRKVYFLTDGGKKELAKFYQLIGVYLKGAIPQLKAAQVKFDKKESKTSSKA
jgi:DNA-binding PadR family transcriptional regulator